MMLSKFSRVIPTCHEGRFGPWFELDWASRPNHSMVARHEMFCGRKVVLARRKLMTYVYAIGIGFKLSPAPSHQWTPDVYEGVRKYGNGLRKTGRYRNRPPLPDPSDDPPKPNLRDPGFPDIEPSAPGKPPSHRRICVGRACSPLARQSRASHPPLRWKRF
ncbi:hypothetical protein TIFTF001_045224 [Ficus carica]|uniref:Uncharacterized protein n=1 Tax=Ficus carica TaxID=3494 RepID=A0AA87YPH1_FICCA|nr:hypothetical protein TIFTF001_045223 [Ficus carica]GMN19698.1 hypothetical protein TIFTF001_045224 [Ficus carica]